MSLSTKKIKTKFDLYQTVQSTQCFKNESFRRYGELKISMLCIYVMYELAKLNKISEQSESELAGYL